MSYTSILVHACPDRSRMARLRCATELAGEFQATIIGVGAEALEPIGLSEDVTASLNREWFDVTRERVVEHLKAAKANFTDVVGVQPHEWRSEWSDPTIAVTRAAIAADLIVSGGECVAWIGSHHGAARRLEFQLHPDVAGDETEPFIEAASIHPAQVRRELHDVAASLASTLDGPSHELGTDALPS